MAQRDGRGGPGSWPVIAHAAGTVLWRPARGVDSIDSPVDVPVDGVEVALVHRARQADWSLPKGKFEPGETAAACALRETWEETGYRAVLGRPLGDVHYALPGTEERRKQVTWFAGRAGTGAFVPNPETDELRWLRPHRAAEMLDYPTDRDVLARFVALPPVTRTVLLVRHAKAGNRSGWTGPDDARPLSPAGREQADALRALLPLFGPTSVFSADRVRCVETVAGVAAAVGLPVVTDSFLSEESYRTDPAATISRFTAIALGGDVPVICSQGGVIPRLISELAERSGLALNGVPCKKGSTWVLSFDLAEPLRLLAAHYIPTALPIPVP